MRSEEAMVYPVGLEVVNVGDDIGVQFHYLIGGYNQVFAVTAKPWKTILVLRLQASQLTIGTKQFSRRSCTDGSASETLRPGTAACQVTA